MSCEEITFHDMSQTRHCSRHGRGNWIPSAIRFVSPESASLRLTSPRLRSNTAGARAPSSRLCRPYRELVIAPSSVRSTYIHRPGEEGEERIVAHARAHSKQYRGSPTETAPAQAANFHNSRTRTLAFGRRDALCIGERGSSEHHPWRSRWGRSGRNMERGRHACQTHRVRRRSTWEEPSDQEDARAPSSKLFDRSIDLSPPAHLPDVAQQDAQTPPLSLLSFSPNPLSFILPSSIRSEAKQ